MQLTITNDALNAFGWFVTAILLLVASVAFHRATRGWSTIVQLVGAGAMFLVCLHDFVLLAEMSHGYISPFFFQGCLERPLVATPVSALRIVTLCFPIGLLWYALRRKRI